MNSHKHTSGPTGFGWVRSLLTFRHRNPVARFISTLVAFAMATLLVVGTGAAYGSDSTPTDPTATDTSTPTPDPAPTADPPPASAPAADPAPTTTSVTSSTTTTSTTSSPKTLSKLSAPAPIVTPNQALVTPITNTGGFEIDGDTINANNGGTDFVDADKVDEGYRDAQGYQGTNKLQDDPSTWSGAQVATEKMDMVNLWVRTILNGPRSAFGIQRDAANGTTAYYFEYNHKPNLAGNVAKPDRSPNDVMFGFTQSGNNAGNTLSFDKAYVYALVGSTAWTAPGAKCTLVLSSSPAGGWCELGTENGVFYSATSDGSGNGATGTYAKGIFAEGIVDFSKLNFPQGSCLGALGHLNVRSQSSLEWTSAMQDFAVADVNVPSTCGQLDINKVDENGTAAPGATFTISQDPRPGHTGAVTVKDGPTLATAQPGTTAIADPDGVANGVISFNPAEPGSYTVAEVAAPTGYLLDNASGTSTNPQSVTQGHTATFNFVDHRIWKGLTATKTANPTYRAEYAWTINKEISPDGTTGWTTSTTSASPLVKKIPAGSPDSLFYRVTVTEGARTTSLYKVSGTISVTNPADNVDSMDAVVTDDLTGATCLVDGVASKSITVAKGAKVDVPYVCTFSGTPTAGQMSGTNTAHVTWDRSTYPQVVGDVSDVGGATRHVDPTAGYDFANAAVTEVNKTVTVTDDQHTFDPAWTITWSAKDATHPSPVYSQTVTADPGSCSDVFANTATVTGDTTTTSLPASDSAYGKVCEGADIDVLDKNATGTLYRSYPWSIQKSTSTPSLDSHVSTTGQYDVTVTTGPGKDATFGMTGTIQVENPNTWGDGIALTRLSDVYYTDSTMTTQVAGSSCTVTDVRTGGTDASPVFTPVTFPYTIPNDTIRTFRYSCTFDPAQPNPPYTGTNKATATWDKAAAYTPNGSDYFAYQVKNDDAQLAKSLTNDWIKNLVNDTITVYDDNATPGDPTDDRHWDLTWSQVYNNNAGHSITLDASSDPSTDIVFDAPAAGTCTTHTNTVTITSDGRPVVESDATAENHQSADDNSADVQICNPATLTGSKTAAPEFTRTYNWHVVKQVRTKAQYGEPAGAWQDVTASWTGDAYSHDFEYRVIVKQGTPVDSAYQMTGTITVHNPNTDSKIPAISAVVSEPATIGGVAATCSIDDGNLATPPNAAVVTLASNTPAEPNKTDVTLPYTCTLAGKPADGTRNSVTVAWGAGPSDSTTLQSPVGGVVYDTPTTEVDKSVTAVDDMGTPAASGDDTTLGTVSWDDAAGPDGYTFPVYSATHTATTTGCSTDNQWTNTVTLSSGRTVKDSDTATAAICPNAGTWEVSKTSDVHDGPVPVDSDITYTLTATKTGGVNPKNVVLVDDLSSLAPHVSLPTQADLDAAAPAGTTAVLSGNVITWTIAELAGSVHLDFTVHVNADAYHVDLPNLVTSTGSDNCDPAKEGFPADECDTDNVTPHYTLRKTSDAGPQVMPPYYGQASGTLITYTLTVHNDSSAPINSTTMSAPDRTVTDDLTDVLDNATLDESSISGPGTASYDPATKKITWVLPAIGPNDPESDADTVTLTYQVRVSGDQWDQQLTNVATPGHGGDCYVTPLPALAAIDGNANCTTTTRTPKYALIQALKVDADNPQQGLQGAKFTLSQGEQVLEENVVSGADGVAHFTTKLQPGTFQVTETQAPAGYALPANPTQEVVVGAADLDNGETPLQVRFDDPPLGALTVAKAHEELSGGLWVPGDGQIAFNDQVKYVITVTATGTKVFHDVKVTDYVPGYNPADTQTQLGGFKADIVGTPTCSAAFTTCSASYAPATGLVTWTLGDVGNTTGTVEFVVRMPDLPRVSPLAAPGVSFAGLMWNQAYLAWTQRDDGEGSAPHTLASNTVTDAASEVLPPKQVVVSPPKQHHPSVLPNTGGPDGLWLAGGLALLVAGGALVLGDRRRRRRS